MMTRCTRSQKRSGRMVSKSGPRSSAAASGKGSAPSDATASQQQRKRTRSCMRAQDPTPGLDVQGGTPQDIGASAHAPHSPGLTNLARASASAPALSNGSSLPQADDSPSPEAATSAPDAVHSVQPTPLDQSPQPYLASSAGGGHAPGPPASQQYAHAQEQYAHTREQYAHTQDEMVAMARAAAAAALAGSGQAAPFVPTALGEESFPPDSPSSSDCILNLILNTKTHTAQASLALALEDRPLALPYPDPADTMDVSMGIHDAPPYPGHAAHAPDSHSAGPNHNSTMHQELEWYQTSTGKATEESFDRLQYFQHAGTLSGPNQMAHDQQHAHTHAHAHAARMAPQMQAMHQGMVMAPPGPHPALRRSLTAARDDPAFQRGPGAPGPLQRSTSDSAFAHRQQWQQQQQQQHQQLQQQQQQQQQQQLQQQQQQQQAWQAAQWAQHQHPLPQQSPSVPQHSAPGPQTNKQDDYPLTAAAAALPPSPATPAPGRPIIQGRLVHSSPAAGGLGQALQGRILHAHSLQGAQTPGATAAGGQAPQPPVYHHQPYAPAPVKSEGMAESAVYPSASPSQPPTTLGGAAPLWAEASTSAAGCPRSRKPGSLHAQAPYYTNVQGLMSSTGVVPPPSAPEPAPQPTQRKASGSIVYVPPEPHPVVPAASTEPLSGDGFKGEALQHGEYALSAPAAGQGLRNAAAVALDILQQLGLDTGRAGKDLFDLSSQQDPRANMEAESDMTPARVASMLGRATEYQPQTGLFLPAGPPFPASEPARLDSLGQDPFLSMLGMLTQAPSAPAGPTWGDVPHHHQAAQGFTQAGWGMLGPGHGAASADQIAQAQQLRLSAPGLVRSRSNAATGGSGGMPGRKQRENLPKAAVGILKKWLYTHITHPYPTEAEKLQLAQESSLDLLQLNNWFINSRVRIWKPMVASVFEAQYPNMEQKAQASGDMGMLHKLMEARRSPAQQLAIILADPDTCAALEEAAQQAAYEVEATVVVDMERLQHQHTS